MNSIQNIIKPHVKAALYTDDLALICSEDSCGTAQVRLQECLTLLEQMDKRLGNVCECCCKQHIALLLFNKDASSNLRLKNQCNTLLERENHSLYLGVTLDPRLTWCKQIENILKNGIRCPTSDFNRLAFLESNRVIQRLQKILDGISTWQAIRDGGGRIYIEWPDGNQFQHQHTNRETFHKGMPRQRLKASSRGSKGACKQFETDPTAPSMGQVVKMPSTFTQDRPQLEEARRNREGDEPETLWQRSPPGNHCGVHQHFGPQHLVYHEDQRRRRR
ncbi:hypothetical protein RRG08_017818 [Elysia crispata]|uniref:Reverse transcriptase domain-containing protein n=1 Tax=Elysia crispata TaxID=231223 RepID=A0AAE1AQX0_9GAST|nr:hypothetical protein RRG08_017818 [Elysia crispata]